MKNLIIPTPTKYKIDYTDSKGEDSNRTIVVINQDEKSLTAYCYNSHGIRTFKKEKIKSITSVS